MYENTYILKNNLTSNIIANVLCNVLLDTAFVGGRKNLVLLLHQSMKMNVYEFLIENQSILYLV